MMDAAQASAAIVGLAAEGLLAFDRLPEAIDPGDGWPSRVRAQPVPCLAPLPIDTTGAEAAVLSAATMALVGVRHASLDTAAAPTNAPTVAALLAACAEARAVARPGFTPVSQRDITDTLAHLRRAHLVFRGAEQAAAHPSKAAS
jgi:hypothetical protein